MDRNSLAVQYSIENQKRKNLISLAAYREYCQISVESGIGMFGKLRTRNA